MSVRFSFWPARRLPVSFEFMFLIYLNIVTIMAITSRTKMTCKARRLLSFILSPQTMAKEKVSRSVYLPAAFAGSAVAFTSRRKP